MKLICIKDTSKAGHSSPITPGKMYFDITSNWTEGFDGPMSKIAHLILNDDGYESWELKENFITIDK